MTPFSMTRNADMTGLYTVPHAFGDHQRSLMPLVVWIHVQRRPFHRAAPVGAGGVGGPHTGVVRITIWVRPGSAHPGVGGEHGGALVVRVSERAVDGRATAAALAAVAAAFGVRRHAVTLVAGPSSRTKIVDVPGADQGALDRLLGL
jgi:uncharacterized protein YggU (UPF0235/DUF167 family)